MFSQDAREAIEDVAMRYNIPTAHLLAVAWVESAGKPFWIVGGEKVVPFLFEPHVFRRRLEKNAPHLIEKAEREGLATRTWAQARKLYPRTYAARIRQRKRAMQIHADSALESTSMGMGQVMLFHWRSLGYRSVLDMYTEMESGVSGQASVMVKFIARNNLIGALRRGDWHAFARGYNGKGYKRNKYHTKIARAAAMFSGASSYVDQSVRAFQSELRKLGYSLTVDGIYGPETKRALKAFQTDRGIVADGIYGPMTRNEIDEALAEMEARKSARDQTAGGVTVGVGTGGAAISDALKDAGDQLSPLADILPIIGAVSAILIVAGVGWGLWATIRRNRVQPVDVVLNGEGARGAAL